MDASLFASHSHWQQIPFQLLQCCHLSNYSAKALQLNHCFVDFNQNKPLLCVCSIRGSSTSFSYFTTDNRNKNNVKMRMLTTLKLFILHHCSSTRTFASSRLLFISRDIFCFENNHTHSQMHKLTVLKHFEKVVHLCLKQINRYQKIKKKIQLHHESVCKHWVQSLLGLTKMSQYSMF